LCEDDEKQSRCSPVLLFYTQARKEKFLAQRRSFPCYFLKTTNLNKSNSQIYPIPDYIILTHIALQEDFIFHRKSEEKSEMVEIFICWEMAINIFMAWLLDYMFCIVKINSQCIQIK